MIPFREYDLRTILANQLNEACNRIDKTPNDIIMNCHLDDLADSLYEDLAVEPVEIDDEDLGQRKIRESKVKRCVDPYFPDTADQYYTTDGVTVTFFFPFRGDKELFQCRASMRSWSGYPEITIEDRAISFSITRSKSEMGEQNANAELLKEARKSIEQIREGISFANKDVIEYNKNLKSFIAQKLVEKREKVESYWKIATSLNAINDTGTKNKTQIALRRRITHRTENERRSTGQQIYYDLDNKDYEDILRIIRHEVSTWERTPDSYATFDESHLRNFILQSLNSVYEGAATGETFRGKGKTDICIEMDNRAAFVAECKIWTGQSCIKDAIHQLNGYLTWRDNKTALIYFVKNKNFFEVLNKAEETLRNVDGIKSVNKYTENEFDCLLVSSSEPGQLIRMRTMFFKLSPLKNGNGKDE